MPPETPIHRLDRPPPPDAQAALPESFGRRYLLFVDTEEEFDWSRPRRRDATSTAAVRALPAAHRRFAGWGAHPAYLVDYPIADDLRAAAVVRTFVDAGEATIGAQLHPWVNPPHDESMTPANSFVGNVAIDIERAKLDMLTLRIGQAFGRRPIVYRAGRYGVGLNSAALLAAAGYRLDVSVRAGFDYRDEGGPDFRRSPIHPWWAAPGLLELPLTAGFTGRLRRLGGRLHALAGRAPHGRGVLARTGLLSRVALTPEGTPLAEALDLIGRLLEDGLRVFSLSFHSPSVEPGHTPYVRDAADLDRFWRWWDGVLDLLARSGVTAATPAELIAAADAGALASMGAPPLSQPH